MAMIPLTLFPPTRSAAFERLARISVADYAATRNHLQGAVTMLSPYLTHGFITLPEVLRDVLARHALSVQHKLVYELGWREYFQHVWHHHRDGIFQSLHQGPLPDHQYSRDLPPDIREARTGVPVIDQGVRTLYATGYLHNHARMWLASYVVHLRKVHWRAGADWMVSHLLDGDLASNHLSWQWIAATGSTKPYLFNADNVARFAPADWHSPGSAVDASYAELERRACSPDAVLAPSGPSAVSPVCEPPCGHQPPDDLYSNPGDIADHDVWLVPPWALGDPPANLADGVIRLGWWPISHHARWPWSDARWQFVGSRMSAITHRIWGVDTEELARRLNSARSVHTVSDLHVTPYLPANVIQHAPSRLFAEIDHPCGSFSSWWKHATRGISRVEDLPGLRSLCSTTQ
ncbi:MAG TPA: FAD-binding domain-containing protein [Aquabacterium sp.]|nr:FAD-binding domain-containing protein [Aquabacterium sp.]